MRVRLAVGTVDIGIGHSLIAIQALLQHQCADVLDGRWLCRGFRCRRRSGCELGPSSIFVRPDVPDGSSSGIAEGILDRTPVGGVDTVNDTCGDCVKRGISS